MKKITATLKTLLVFLAFTNMNAQVTNGDFEIVNNDGLVNQWGMDFFKPYILDTTGLIIYDTILYDNPIQEFAYATTDSYLGQYALKITNAFDVTQNIVLPGDAFLNNGQNGCWGPRLNDMTTISPYNNGYNFGFFYKFTSMGNDVAQANLELFDQNAISIGKATVAISGTNSSFNYIYTPVNFTTTGVTPVFMTISFTMAKEDSVPTFGSSLIIDNVTINSLALQTNNSVKEQFKVYPTIANQEINIKKDNITIDGNCNFQIINLEGKLLSENILNFSNSDFSKIDVSQLSPGIYFLKTNINTKENKYKFIKK